MGKGLNIKVKKVACHRNGVSGEAFHVVTFDWDKQPMVGIVFQEPRYVAVLAVDLLAAGIVEFAQNSWRGDDFEPALRAAVAEYEAGRSNG